MKVRHIKECDWNRILEIQQQSYPEELIESKESLQAKQQSSVDTCFVIEIDNTVEAYLFALPYELGKSPSLNSAGHNTLPSDNLHVHDFCISTKCQSGGYGRKIIDYVVSSPPFNYFKTVSLVSVMGSRYFWESMGFSLLTDKKLTDKKSLDLTTYGQHAYYLSRELAP